MAAILVVARVVAILPWSWLRFFGGFLGAFAGSIFRIRRAHVEQAMERAGLSPARTLSRGMYASLGTSICEFLWMVGRGGPPRQLFSLKPRAEHALARYGVRGPSSRGVVLATAHTGNWDFVACAVAAGGVPLTVVTKRLRIGWLDRFWQGTRAGEGIELVDGDGAFDAARRAIARGRSVALLVDQAPERSSAVTEASFLGERARCDCMPALLAARTGVPLLLALGHRNTDGTHSLDVPLVLEPPTRPTRAWVEHATCELNRALEDFVRANPSQWLWLHRRWKTRAGRLRAPSSLQSEAGTLSMFS